MTSHSGIYLPRAFLRIVSSRGLRSALLLVLAPVAALAGTPGATARPAPRLSMPERITFPKSIGNVAPATSLTASPSFGRIARANLTADELATTMNVRISLKMPHLGELTGRVHSGETIPNSEMESRYLPPRKRSDALVAWLRSQGLAVSRVDANHTFISVSGTVSQLARAFGVTFARVSTPRGEFTSAVTAPSLPSSVGRGVLSIDGLQAVIPFHPMGGYSVNPTNVPALAPMIYSFPAGLNGDGVTIAIAGQGQVSTSDISTFWSTYHVPDTLSNLVTAPVNVEGVVPGSGEGNSLEDTLDVSMASSVAPSAVIRLYESDDFFADFEQILADRATIPSMTVATASYGVDLESDLPEGEILSISQLFAQLAASGMTVFTSSGDGGTNPYRPEGGSAGYDPGNAPLGVDYPATDPNIIAVGGTVATVTPNAEIAWASALYTGLSTAQVGEGYSGGGYSTIFPVPSWQQNITPFGQPGPSTMRMIPDVSAMAYDAAIEFEGSLVGLGGTSEASPTWAGMAALLNQSRATAGVPPLGLLAPQIYPLLGTSAFNDITVGGSNGAYFTGAGYDLVTGIGSPDIAVLASVLDNAPYFTAQPSITEVIVGSQATFLVNAGGTGILHYSWIAQAPGQISWNLVPGTAPYSGAATSSLGIEAAPLSLNGATFASVVSNSYSSNTSSPASLLVVNPLNVSAFTTGLGTIYGVAIDSSGFLYVADFGDSVVWKITPTGSASVYAGKIDIPGTNNGVVGTGQLNGPISVAVDAAGNV